MFRVLVFTLLLSGCAALGTKEASVGCQAADGITTALALKAGLVEANPLLAGLSLPGILIVKAVAAILLVTYHNEIGGGVPVANGVTCAVALHNLLLIP